MNGSFIGGGVMAEAILGGILNAGIAVPADVRFGEPIKSRRSHLADTYGVIATSDNGEALKDTQIVILAVKPQHLGPVMNDLKDHLKPGQAVLSIVAGATLKTLSRGLQHKTIVRVMPNTPAQVRQGMTVWTATDDVSEQQHTTAQQILGSFGEEVFVADEKYMDMATALSASGPAYVFLFVEALIDSGVYMGLQRDMSRKLVLQTVLGSTEYVRQAGQHPAELKDMVSSPAGGTVEALRSFEQAGFRAAVIDAVTTAYKKYQALGKTD